MMLGTVRPTRHRSAARVSRGTTCAHERRGPAATGAATVDGRRIPRRAGAGAQEWTDGRAAAGRLAAGDGDRARRFPSALFAACYFRDLNRWVKYPTGKNTENDEGWRPHNADGH